MSFFNKLKEGASKAADKAKDSVEVVRLTSQISAKRKDIEKVYLHIGETVFKAHQSNQSDDRSDLTEYIQNSSNIILMLEAEITELEAKIKAIKDEKDCVCGQVIPLDSKFCPHCGNRFEEAAAETAAAQQPIALEAPADSSEN